MSCEPLRGLLKQTLSQLSRWMRTWRPSLYTPSLRTSDFEDKDDGRKKLQTRHKIWLPVGKARQTQCTKLLISKLCLTASQFPARQVHSTSRFSPQIISFPYVMRFHWKWEIILPETSPVGSEEASSRQPAG